MIGDVNIKLSDRIKEYRKKNNLTQEDLANQLYVSKQAVSKWENDKSLPDISLFPIIAKMLDISVDELMGSESKVKDKKVRNLGIVSSIPFVIVLLVVLILVLPLGKSDNKKKQELVNQTETNLGLKLPEIEKYDLIQYYQWAAFNNSIYPEEMYYFIFKDEIIKIDETWMEEIPEAMIEAILVSSSEYPYICDYYKLVDLVTDEIIKIDNSDSKVHQYILYCLQIQNRRLIAIKFEV